MSIFCFDIDNTICRIVNGDYARAEPIPSMVEYIRRLHDEGHKIVLHTARGTVTGANWRQMTEDQLESWGVPCDELHFGKPYADFYVDDRAVSCSGIAAIIQARMGSTRLPGKVLMDIGGKPLLAHVVERTQAAIPHVILATTWNSPEIITFAQENGIPYYAGSEDDVLDRYYQAAMQHAVRTVVRVTSDNPLIDPQMLSKLVQFYQDGGYDWAANCRLKVTYPVGNDAEIFSIGALKRIWRAPTTDLEREHVTSYIYNHPELFKLGVMENDKDESHLRWTVDTSEDLERVRGIYADRRKELCLTHG